MEIDIGDDIVHSDVSFLNVCLNTHVFSFFFLELLPFHALYLLGDCNKSLITDDTCRGIRIKSPLTLPSTVAREGCQGEAA